MRQLNSSSQSIGQRMALVLGLVLVDGVLGLKGGVWGCIWLGFFCLS